MIPPPGDVPSTELQRLDAADIEKVASQCRDLFEDATWRADAVQRSLDAPGSVALLARRAGHAAGLVLARVAADECEVLWLVVLTPWRRKGIGRSLLQAALQTAASLGAATAYLEVSQTNRAAIGLYGAAGFQPCGRRRAYYKSGCEACNALLYKKALGSGETCPSQSPVNRVKIVEAQAR
jgi:ribosomal-protein-alanine N-acetyltransferase